MVEAFEGNKAETKIMLPDVTVVADAGVISEANQHAIEDAGLSYHPDPGQPSKRSTRPAGLCH